MSKPKQIKEFLTQQEKQNLLQNHKKLTSKEADRIKAIYLHNLGWNYKQIAIPLMLDDETIRRHIKDYLAHKNLSTHYKGGSSALDEKQTQQLSNHLQENTYLYVKEILDHVQDTYGVTYSLSGMKKWLYRNDFRYKKPHAVPAKADQLQQEAFLETYNQLKQTTQTANEPIYFVDSVHPHHQTRLAYGWIKKGKRKLLPTTGRQYRLNIIGGVSLSHEKFVYHKTDKVNTETIKEFLVKLREEHPKEKKIHLILDNAGYHKNKEIQKYSLEAGIALHYLPPYSPNLNIIERVWKKMHEAITYNRYYKSFNEFKEKIVKYLDKFSLGEYKCYYDSYLKDKFNVLNSPLLV